jgi:hypothetical protein
MCCIEVEDHPDNMWMCKDCSNNFHKVNHYAVGRVQTIFPIPFPDLGMMTLKEALDEKSYEKKRI